jgi:hypothetical protein
MAYSPTQSVQFQNLASVTTSAFSLKGGLYGIAVTATFGGGNVQLQMLSIDGATWFNVATSITAAGLTTQQLPPGQYRVVITTATAVFIAIDTIPTG